MEPKKLGDILKETMDQLGGDRLKAGLSRGKAVLMWPEVAGEKIAKHTEATALRGNTLFVTTDSAAWAQELSIMRNQLIRKMNEAAGEYLVADVRFQPKGQPRRRPKGARPQAPR